MKTEAEECHSEYLVEFTLIHEDRFRALEMLRQHGHPRLDLRARREMILCSEQQKQPFRAKTGVKKNEGQVKRTGGTQIGNRGIFSVQSVVRQLFTTDCTLFATHISS